MEAGAATAAFAVSMAERPHRQTGFSLLEAIVTLVIFSLLVTVLMQSLQQALQVRERVFLHQQSSRVDLLQLQWFSDSLSSAITNPDTAADRMEGAPMSLRLVSQAPLDGSFAQPVEWSLRPVEGGRALYYSSATWPDLIVLQGPLRQATFEYLDGSGAWRTTWEPGTGEQVRLPRAIRLRAETENGSLDWWVALPVEKSPPTLLLPKEKQF